MGDSIKSFDCAGKTTREINAFLKSAARMGHDAEVVLQTPDCRHNIAVGIVDPLHIRIEGHVGYYCGGLCDGVHIHIAGDAGWGLAENLMQGRVTLEGNAGAAAGATLRGGTLVVKGDAGARCGVAMKGGTLVVGGSVGAMSAFMMQKGALIICGDAGEALGDSLYEGKIFLRGRADSLGSDAVLADLTEADVVLLSLALDEAGIVADAAGFQKIVSGKRLYNYSTKEKEIWRLAL